MPADPLSLLATRMTTLDDIEERRPLTWADMRSLRDCIDRGHRVPEGPTMLTSFEDFRRLAVQVDDADLV